MLNLDKIKQIRKLISEEINDRLQSDFPSPNYSRLLEAAGLFDVIIKKLENPNQKDYKIEDE